MLYIVACGGSSTPKKVDAKIVDTKSVDVAVTCKAKATYSPTFGSGSSNDQYAFNHDVAGSNYTQNLQWQGYNLTSGAQDFLDMEFYSGTGSGSWPTGNVTPKSGIDLATEYDAYIILGANVNGSGQAQDIYLSTAGTVNLTTSVGSLVGTVSGLMLQHVDITSSGISADPDGCMSSVGNFSFNHTYNGSGSAAGPGDIRDVMVHTTSLLHE